MAANAPEASLRRLPDARENTESLIADFMAATFDIGYQRFLLQLTLAQKLCQAEPNRL
jgi:hypothetical protein